MTVDLFHVYKERMLLDGIRAGHSVNYHWPFSERVDET